MLPGMDDVGTLITQTEAVRLLGVHRSTLLRWEELGRLTPVKLPSGHRRYRLTDIESIRGDRASA